MTKKPIPVSDVDPLRNWFRFPLNLSMEEERTGDIERLRER